MRSTVERGGRQPGERGSRLVYRRPVGVVVMMSPPGVAS
jgi:hypothetical protein